SCGPVLIHNVRLAHPYQAASSFSAGLPASLRCLCFAAVVHCINLVRRNETQADSAAEVKSSFRPLQRSRSSTLARYGSVIATLNRPPEHAIGAICCRNVFAYETRMLNAAIPSA